MALADVADTGDELDRGAVLVAGEGGAVADVVLDALCTDHIARFKRPKEYRWVEALPKNAYGKVLKTELRGQLA